MINFIVALPAEARPLTDFYRLRDKDSAGPFPVYRNDTVALAVSGIGKVPAAAATAYLQGLTRGNRHCAWLNVGIAGHARRRIGEGLLAHCITDHTSGRSWYPPQVHRLTIPTDNLLSVETPAEEYREDTLHDMEAAGFYPIACRSATAELVQCYKIVSDNREQPAAAVTARQCTELIADRLAEIDDLADTLAGTAAELTGWHALQSDLEAFTQRWRFSVSQQHQLARLVRRWENLAPEEPVWCQELGARKSAGEVLHWLRQRVETLPDSRY